MNVIILIDFRYRVTRFAGDVAVNVAGNVFVGEEATGADRDVVARDPAAGIGGADHGICVGVVGFIAQRFVSGCCLQTRILPPDNSFILRLVLAPPENEADRRQRVEPSKDGLIVAAEGDVAAAGCCKC